MRESVCSQSSIFPKQIILFMKITLTKIFLLVMIMSVSVFFIGCNKNDKTTEQNNNGQSNNSSISPVPNESNKTNETNLATDANQNQPEKENSGITTIRKYYSFLSNNNLEEAYQMRSDQTKTSYEKFKGWYENAQYLKPSDFNKTNSGSYQFYVDYKDHDEAEIKFRVEMLAIEDKIKTLSSVEVVEGEKNEGDVSNWLVYTNEEFKYRISYPMTYAVTEYGDNSGGIFLNFKDTNNVNYHANEIFVRVGDGANTVDGLLAEIKKECDEGSICADISEDKIVDLSNVKGVRKITYSRAIGCYATSYFFAREDGEKLNFEISFNFEEDEVRGKIIDSFEFF